MRNPYITGPYVAGRRHYGRHGLPDHLLHGEANADRVIGNRRIGKTSLLRQLEALALVGETGERRYLPIFWDMQVATCSTVWAATWWMRFRNGWLRFNVGFPMERMQEANVLTLLPALRRWRAYAGRELLLLCDETEVLINLASTEPELAQGFTWS